MSRFYSVLSITLFFVFLTGVWFILLNGWFKWASGQ